MCGSYLTIGEIPYLTYTSYPLRQEASNGFAQSYDCTLLFNTVSLPIDIWNVCGLVIAACTSY